MRFRKSGYWVYALARTTLRNTGLIHLLSPQVRAVLARAIYQISNGGSAPALVHGHRMYLAPRGRYAPLDMIGDRFEVSTTEVFEERIKPGHTMIDIGGHVGYYTLLAARLVGPNGKVYVFEPEPENHALLLKNVALNGYTNVTAVHKAVSSKNGPCALFLSSVDTGLHSLFRLNLPERGSVPAETTTLDSFLAKEGWPKVDLIKIDVEGAEFDVLDGMAETLERMPDVTLVIEFCPWILQTVGYAPTDLLEKLQSLKFQVHVLLGKEGATRLEQVELDALVHRLLRKDGYANLLCTRG